MNILIAYHAFLSPDANAGCLRLLEMIRILRAAGHAVTFLAHQNKGSRTEMEALGVECICDEERGLSLSPPAFAVFLRDGKFGAAIMVQYFVYNYYAPYFKAFLPACHRILDTVDIHFLRLKRQAELQPHMAALAQSVERDEKRALRDAQSIWVVTDTEQQTLRPLSGGAHVGFFVIPTLHPVLADRPDFDHRAGLVFIGSYNHAPNLDAVEYFVQEILPPLRVLLPDVPVSIAGSAMPDAFYAFAGRDPHLHMAGFVDDHRALLAASRVGIAPLRFGAGMKGKIGEFLACGLPCVTTPIGAEGMGLTDGTDILVAETAQAFAERVARLYTDRDLWQTLSEAGIAYIDARVTPQAIAPTVMAAVAFAEAAAPSAAPLVGIVARWQLRRPAERRLLPQVMPGLWERIKRRVLRVAWVGALRARLKAASH